MTRPVRLAAALAGAALTMTLAALPASAAPVPTTPGTTCGGGVNDTGGHTWKCTPDRSNNAWSKGLRTKADRPTVRNHQGYAPGTVFASCESAVVCTITSTYPQRRIVVIGDLASPYPGPASLPTEAQVRYGQEHKGQQAPDALSRRGYAQTDQGVARTWVPLSYLLWN